MSHPASNDATRPANSSHLDTTGYQFFFTVQGYRVKGS